MQGSQILNWAPLAKKAFQRKPASRVRNRQNCESVTLLARQSEFDLALKNPNAYFMVTRPDGSQAYTKDGRFRLNRDRILVTQEGDIVGQGIQIPQDFGKLMVSPTGEVSIKKKGRWL